MTELLQARGIRKGFELQGERLSVLEDLDLSLGQGESLGIMGPSGSGKTTLLSILGALMAPEAGRVLLAGADPYAVTEGERDRLRNRELGFLFQFHNLIPELNALENAAMPCFIRGDPWPLALKSASALLKELGLAGRAASLPHQLSGGERQRAALARALACSPRLLIADEPTGNLDRAAADRVQSMLLERAKAGRTAVIVATHNESLASSLDRVLILENGRLRERKASSSR